MFGKNSEEFSLKITDKTIDTMKHLILVIFITFLGFQLFGQTISISTHHVKPGSTVQLSFNAPSSYPENAWIGIVPSNIEHGSEAVNDKHDLTYQYLKKRTSGSLSFKVPAQEGNYDFRMHDTDNNGREVASVSFVVSTSSATLSSGSGNKSYSGNSRIEGTYTTDFKEMTLTISGNHVTGSYKHMGGKIEGTLNGNKLIGTWWQTNGKGRIEFVFNSDFTQFSGKWGYNDAAPTSKWNGTKTSGTSTSGHSATSVEVNTTNTQIKGTYKTDFGEMSLHVNGNRVTGTYKYRDGKVEGILNGNTLTGTWTQSNGKGRLVFVFNSDFSAFTGKWNYNDNNPTSKWNGTKL
jgi:hypothetical protein